jgi:hypothetical protein
VFDQRRKERGLVTRHRVRRLEAIEPQPVSIQTEIKLEASTPAYVGYGFATREEFMNWRLSLLRQVGQRYR